MAAESVKLPKRFVGRRGERFWSSVRLEFSAFFPISANFMAQDVEEEEEEEEEEESDDEEEDEYEEVLYDSGFEDDFSIDSFNLQLN